VRITTIVLGLACVVFATMVWTRRPAVPAPRAMSPAEDVSATAMLAVPRGVVMRPLVLPARIDDVDLSAMPDRLANEAAPSSWRRVVTVRGVPGVAAVEGPAVVAWTENGIAYRLASPTRSTEELIKIADELR
jgi:hypothetical protein